MLWSTNLIQTARIQLLSKVSEGCHSGLHEWHNQSHLAQPVFTKKYVMLGESCYHSLHQMQNGSSRIVSTDGHSSYQLQLVDQ